MTKQTNIFLRLAALMVLTIMSAVAAWGQTVLVTCTPGNTTSGNGSLTIGSYTITWNLFGGKSDSNSVTYNGKAYYKLTKDITDNSHITITATEDFQVGDKITIDGYRNSSSNTEVGFNVNQGTVLKAFTDVGAQDLTYTLTAADLTSNPKEIKITRYNSNAPFIHSITITRSAITEDARVAEVEDYHVEYTGSTLQSSWQKQTPDDTNVYEDENGVHVVNNSDGTGNNWNLQFQINEPVSLTAGEKYKFTFRMKSNVAGYIGLNLGGSSNYSGFQIAQSSDWVNYYVEYTPTETFDCVMLMQSKNLVGNYDLQSFTISHDVAPLPEPTWLGQITLNNSGQINNIGGDLVSGGHYTNTTITNESPYSGSWPVTFTAIQSNAVVHVFDEDWTWLAGGTNTVTTDISNPATAGATNKYWIKVEGTGTDGKKYTQIYDLNMHNSNLGVTSAEFQLPATKTLVIGEGYSQDVVVKVTLTDGTVHNVSTSGTPWTFSNPAVAGQVSGTRVVAGYSVGTTTFTMSKYPDEGVDTWTFEIPGKQGPEQDGKFKIPVSSVTSQITTITVSAPTVTFSPTGNLTKNTGDEFQPTATLSYTGPGSPASFTFSGANDNLSVTSSNTGVALVGSNGWVTANSAGSSTITVQIPEGTEIKRSFPDMWNNQNYETTFTLPASSTTINLTVAGPEAVLVPVTGATTWTGNSWTSTYRQQVDTYSYLIRDANNANSGYTLKALGSALTGNYAITFPSNAAVNLPGSADYISNVPVTRALYFEVTSSGKVSVKINTLNRPIGNDDKDRYLQVGFEDKEGVWHNGRQIENRWMMYTGEFDPNKEVIIDCGEATTSNPHKVYLFTTSWGLDISSITWTPITDDQISTFNLQTPSSTTFTNLGVGAKWTNKITITATDGTNTTNITKQGHFVVTGTKKISVMIDETDNCAYIVGEEVGENIKASITWVSNDGSYTNATKTFTGSVAKGTVTMAFVPTSGEIVKGRSFIPTVVFTRGDGREATGLTETLTITTGENTVAKLEEGMVTGVAAGTATITASFAGNDKYAAAQTASSYTLKVINNTPATGADKKDKEDRLVMIPYTPNYYSPNMADYWWYDEAGGDDNIRHSATVPMVRLHTYLSSDNRFRVYSTGNDELIDNGTQKGLMLKDSRSWIEFYAQGTATLTIKGYATTPRVLELYAVNDVEYDGNDMRDPDLSKATKVMDITVPQTGPFTVSSLVSQPAKNYYFLKTSVGGIYISTIDWTNSLRKPYITIKNVDDRVEGGTITQNGEYEPGKIYLNSIYSDLPDQSMTECHYALDHTTGHMRVIETARLEIKAWTYTGLDDTGTEVNIPVPAWPMTDGRAMLTFASSDENVAKVDSTGLIIPMSQGVCKIYVYLNAGSVTSGSNDYTYGAQRAEFWLHINSEAVDVDFVDNKNSNAPTIIEEVLYSPYSSTTMTWPEVFVTKYGEWTAIPEKDSDNNENYTLTYHLLDENGKTLTSPISTYIEIDEYTGVLTFNDNTDAIKEALDDMKFRVAVEMSSSKYVNQRSYYILTYTNGLTIPSVKFHSNGMKELSDAKGVKATNKQANFNKYREYFARAEENVSLTFTIPSTTTGMTSYYKVYDALPDAPPTWSTTNDGSTTGNTFTVNIDAPNSHCTKFVCVHMEKGTATWDGVYMITFFKMPSHEVDGSPSNTIRTATMSSSNSSFNNSTYGATPLELHYTTDTSDPTADDKKPNAQGQVTFTTNTILRYIEVFVAPEGLTLTDEYGSQSTTFSTRIPDDVQIPIKADNVFYTGDYGKTDSKFPTEASMFTVATSGTPTQYDPSSTNYKVTFMPKTATGYDDAELIVMFGSKHAPIYRESTFLHGGHSIPKANPAKDDGITSYIDIYDKFVKSDDAYKDSSGDRKKLSFKPDGNYYNPSDHSKTYTTTGNPNTEWNTLIGGVIHDRRPQGGLYLAPVSGDFIRFEAEYSGIVSVWLRSNGSTASNATKNVNAINDKYASETTKVSYTNPTTGMTTTMELRELKRTIEKMEQADLTRRPVYIMDENGKIMQRNTMAYSYDSYADINGVVADISMQSKFGTDLDHAWNYNQKYYYDSQALDDLIELTNVAQNTYSINTEKIKYTEIISDYKKKLSGLSGSGGRNYIDDMQFYADKYAFDLETTKVDQNYKITEVIYCDNAAETRSSFAKYGFELPNSNYIRYRFPVTAGKTYYIGGRGTKNFFSAMKFEKDDACDDLVPDADSKAIKANVLDGEATTASAVATTHAWMSTTPAGTQMNVAVKRTFKKDKWHPIVLPFSVSESRMRQIFGEKVRVLMLDEAFGYDYKNPAAVQGSKLTFTRHYYQMLYANVPAYVCPSKDVVMNYQTPTDPETTGKKVESGGDCVLFERVTYEGNTIKVQTIGDAGFKWTGSYSPVSATETGDMYYMSNKENTGTDKDNYNSADGTTADYVAKLYHAKEGQAMKATRCWIKAPAVSRGEDDEVPVLTHVAVAGFGGNSLDNNFSIDVDMEHDEMFDRVVTPDTSPNVYSLQGMKVGKVGEDSSLRDVLNRLPAGIYIYHGRKYVVR